jgi:hypothetical protein
VNSGLRLHGMRAGLNQRVHEAGPVGEIQVRPRHLETQPAAGASTAEPSTAS